MTTSRIILTSVLAVLVLLATACGGHRAHAAIPSGTAPYDQRFLTWLVNHHNDDDRMVNPCANKENILQELREFCVQVRSATSRTCRAYASVAQGVVWHKPAQDRQLDPFGSQVWKGSNSKKSSSKNMSINMPTQSA